ncbi:hypothetical protein [Rhizobium sp. WYCCWR 11146]|uniref:hypothetical protein n=1 Tax=Rhizobium sp. WYCCWR 11146 TaxID=2749833 RepID=UPI0015E73265|nr:hypothetical protein [Rhizobium sp. WYCCWR 11146]MBA1343910.1 hypothetical protein [Rhizobium sp. WYCCWR 11146]
MLCAGFLRPALGIFGLFFASVAVADARDIRIVDIAAGDTADIHFQFNLGGRLFLNVADRNGPACVTLWWIIWPTSEIHDVGRKCGQFEVQIPSIFYQSLWSKLRGRAGAEPLKIGYSAEEHVVGTIKFDF